MSLLSKERNSIRASSAGLVAEECVVVVGEGKNLTAYDSKDWSVVPLKRVPTAPTNRIAFLLDFELNLSFQANRGRKKLQDSELTT